MRAKLPLLSALVLGALSGVVVAGCQSYDFEPVEPLAIAQTTVEETISALASKPNIMMLVDISGSMTLPVDTSRPSCQVQDKDGLTVLCGNENACPTATCPTRWSELQAAVPQFLANSGPYVRFALTTYPEASTGSSIEACTGPTATSVRKDLPVVEDDASLLAHANSINDLIQGIPNHGTGQPVGGTPTSGSLNFIGSMAGLQDKDRKNFVILLTDGLPNCNPENEYSGRDQPELCKCTIAGNLCGSQISTAFEKRGCLDTNASVRAVQALSDKKITTIVIGFGAETASGDGPAVLQAMASAGGFARSCTDDPTACGANDTCIAATGLCGRAFYQAGNQVELADALERISKEVLNLEPCLIPLKGPQLPSDPKLIVVYIEGERTLAGDGTWSLTSDGVLFNGAACERIKNSRPEAPIKIEVRAIRQR
ncbi:adventurous gliding motility lipoprotein CglB [Myxococcus sp. CA051A]|uniref:adventurous gliding motility lipoprotein CglB n=1 Tax=unclassified Myxococcus TaxID=2648731 RepID=UPI00157B4776|nr:MULTISPECIES: adventurous gliding motility lipoprotein CglB [unclassified Myxococcus]NTX35337.1 adventurous gliding motility lipoprotein CglB [Myxococcus sp. CA033]NTX62248.1 adventurous gliding motility lipoprotein CglB [Myxococcus sp. CA051A]